MIDKSLKQQWAQVAYQYIVDNSGRYRGCIPSGCDIVSGFLENLLDENFRREVNRQNIYDDDVEEKIEKIFNRIIQEEGNENGDKMTRRRAMAESLKITYATSDLDRRPN